MPHFGMAVICFILFLTFLDNTVISATLSDVQSGLHAGVAQLQWVVSGYALAFASLMLMAGTLGDLYGRKKLMLIGVVIFCGGSVLSALADTTNLPHRRTGGHGGRGGLLGAGHPVHDPTPLPRAPPAGPGPRRSGRRCPGLALAMGPVIGGVLVGLWSWRAVFWFNLIFGAVALVAAAVVLPENSDPVRARLDIPGFVLGAVALGMRHLRHHRRRDRGLHHLVGAARSTGWPSSGLVAFVLVELRAENPVLDVRFFRRPPFAGSTVLAFTSYFGIFSIFFFVALYLEVVGAHLALPSGPRLHPHDGRAWCWPRCSPGAGCRGCGPRIPMIIGCVLAAAGIFLTDALISPHAGLSTVGWTLAVAGIGFGIVIVPVTSSALTSVPAEHSGMAASTNNTSRELGAVAGVAILGSIVNGQLTVNLAARLVAIGIPASFRSQVIAAVTTGSLGLPGGRTQAGKGNASIQQIINKVGSAAYGAFGHGLDLALLAAGALLTGVGRGGLLHRGPAAAAPAEDPLRHGRSGRPGAVGPPGTAGTSAGRWARTNSPTAR